MLRHMIIPWLARLPPPSLDSNGRPRQRVEDRRAKTPLAGQTACTCQLRAVCLSHSLFGTRAEGLTSADARQRR
eukprot:7546124-Alexandrium_andersonii.AAC.1